MSIAPRHLDNLERIAKENQFESLSETIDWVLTDWHRWVNGLNNKNIIDISKIENKVKLSKPFIYKVSQMNPTLEYIYNHPKETKRIIGITYEQLIKLIAKAQIIESEKKEAIAKTEKRLIKAGGGRKKNLTKEEEIILTLFYLHQIPTFQTLGINFGISESSANNIFHYWIDILRELLPASLLEQVKKKKMNWNG